MRFSASTTLKILDEEDSTAADVMSELLKAV